MKRSNPKEDNPPIIGLQYRKGDLIMKQGDYGIAIYKILQGKVSLYNESGIQDIELTTLGPGEVIGEMAMLTGAKKPRTASARALEECKVEVWHPEHLIKDYENIPPILKYIIDQGRRRLIRMNRLLEKLNAEKIEEEAVPTKSETLESKREFYRKELNTKCLYRPLTLPKKYPSDHRLEGFIQDISRGGLSLVVNADNALNISHDYGDEFIIMVILPNGHELNLPSTIVWVTESDKDRKLYLGMKFKGIDGESNKKLGFFLMP
jgi:hypothetical protein